MKTFSEEWVPRGNKRVTSASKSQKDAMDGVFLTTPATISPVYLSMKCIVFRRGQEQEQKVDFLNNTNKWENGVIFFC